jgi:hypothetical protein
VKPKGMRKTVEWLYQNPQKAEGTMDHPIDVNSMKPKKNMHPSPNDCAK